LGTLWILIKLYKELDQIDKVIQALECLERIEIGKTRKVGRAPKAGFDRRIQEIRIAART